MNDISMAKNTRLAGSARCFSLDYLVIRLLHMKSDISLNVN